MGTLCVEELAEGLFRIELGLGSIPLRTVNAYLLLSGERPLLVDPGPYEEEAVESLSSLLRQMGADIEKTDVFVTHFHIDHIGQAYALSRRSARIFFNRIEAGLLQGNLEKRWELLKEAMSSYGFPKKEIDGMEAFHPIRLLPKVPLSFTPIEDGQLLKRGDLNLLVLSTPGHSPGHCCLYEPKGKLLLSGDHVLEAITPHVGFWPETEDPLGVYLESLLKTRDLEVQLALPGHGPPFSGLKARVEGILLHHKRRCEEVLRVLDEPKTAYEVASLIHWDVKGDWAELPPQQKWFALSETVAHLQYLVKNAKVKRDLKGKVWVFRRTPQ